MLSVRTVETDTLYASPEQLIHIHCSLAGSNGIGPTRHLPNSDILHFCFGPRHVFSLFYHVVLCICDHDICLCKSSIMCNS